MRILFHFLPAAPFRRLLRSRLFVILKHWINLSDVNRYSSILHIYRDSGLRLSLTSHQPFAACCEIKSSLLAYIVEIRETDPQNVFPTRILLSGWGNI